MQLLRLLGLSLLLSASALCRAAGPLTAAPATPSPASAAVPTAPSNVPGPPPPGGESGQPSPAQAAVAVEGNPDWAVTLERIASSVVSINVDQTRAFDTEWNTTAQATGFVVDAERGLILTNRHVVTPGPVTSEATFLDRKSVV